MSKITKVLSALPYAHLLGMSAAAKADDDDMKQRADESDEDYAKRMEDDEKKKDEDAKKAKKAEDDKKKEDAEKGGDGVDDEDDGDDDKKEKAARQSERTRCAAIFSCGAAGTRPDMAAHLAFNTDMSAKAATDMLQAIAAGTPVAAGGLAQRMNAVKTPNVGSGAASSVDPSSSAGVAAAIIAAGKARRGEA